MLKKVTKRSRRWIDDAPVNPITALMVKGGVDEALNANVFITAAGAVSKKMTPRYTSGVISKIFHWEF